MTNRNISKEICHKQALNGFTKVADFVLEQWCGCADYEIYKTYLDTIHSALKQLQHYEETKMTKRNIKKEINYSYYPDYENGTDIETICHPSLICILEEIIDRIETIEKDIDFLKSYAWEQ